MNSKSLRSLVVARGVRLIATPLLLGVGTVGLRASPQEVGRAPVQLTSPAVNDVSNAVTNAIVLVGGGCTGTLIAPNIVLTAAHCLKKPFEGEWTGWRDERAVWVPFTFPAFTASDCCVSALRGQPAQPGRDLPGFDIASTTLDRPDPALCSASCDGNGSCQAWTFVNPGVQGLNARCYLKRAGVTVAFGNDRRVPIYTAFGSQYSMPGRDDIAMIRLEQPVPVTIAQPAPILTKLPRGQAATSWLGAHSYAFSGWGGGHVILRTAAAAFAEYPFVSFGRLERNMMRLTGAGGVSLEPGDSGSPAFINTPRCRADASVAGRYVAGVAQGVERSGGRFVATFAPGGLDADGTRQPNVGRWIASAVYTSHTVITELEVTIGTDDDDLRGGAVAYGVIGLTGGRTCCGST